MIGMSALMLLLHMENCRQAELYDLAESRTALARGEGARIPAAQELAPSSEGGDYASLYAAAKYDVVIETTGCLLYTSGPYPLCRHLRLGYPSVQRHL